MNLVSRYLIIAVSTCASFIWCQAALTCPAADPLEVSKTDLVVIGTPMHVEFSNENSRANSPGRVKRVNVKLQISQIVHGDYDDEMLIVEMPATKGMSLDYQLFQLKSGFKSEVAVGLVQDKSGRFKVEGGGLCQNLFLLVRPFPPDDEQGAWSRLMSGQNYIY